MNFLELTQNKLDLNEINSLLAHETCGGVSFFVGTTRDFFEDKKVVSLEYEAYEAMAKQTLAKICEQMRNNWNDIKHIAIYHRLGLVPVKEASVIIGVSSPHRRTSLEAVQYAIEELKKSVPIWKKERYADPEAKNMKRKLPQLNFDDCPIEEEPLPKHLVQINADYSEVQRRVTCFINRKRKEIDENNIRDFINNERTPNSDEESSCARLNSTVYRKGARTHLKVHRVRNEYGPQTRTDEYTGTLDKLMFTSYSKGKPETPAATPCIIEERLVNAEKFLNVEPDGAQNIYARIKNIEDRILYLETVSPEYHHFLQKNTSVAAPKTQKKMYTVTELEKYIQHLCQSNS